MRRIGEGLAASAAGLPVLVLILELGLRLFGAGAGTPPVVQRRLDGDLDQASLRTLCIGDSFTFGLGAPRDRSYPQQLQERLEERMGEHQVAVVNLGLPSATTGDQRALLPEALAAVKPHAAIVLLGGTSLKDPRAAREAATGEHAHYERGVELRLPRLLGFLREDIRAARLEAQGSAPGGDGAVRARGFIGMRQLPRPGRGALGCSEAASERYARVHGLLEADALAAALAVLDARPSTDADPCPALLLAEAVVHDLREDGAATHAAVERGLERFPCDHGLQQAEISLLSSQGLHCEVAERLEAWRGRCRPDEPLPIAQIADATWRCGETQQAARWYERCAEQERERCSCRWGLARTTLEGAAPEQVSATLASFVTAVPPGCTQATDLPTLLCQAGLDDQAVAWAEANIARDPPDWLQQLGSIIACAEPRHLPQLEAVALGAGLEPAAVASAMETMAEQGRLLEEMKAWTVEELSLIADEIEASGATPILATYPYPNGINPGVRELAARRGLPLLDFERAIQARLDRGESRWDYFTRDGDDPLVRNDHCNEHGYGVLADEAADLLLSLELD